MMISLSDDIIELLVDDDAVPIWYRERISHRNFIAQNLEITEKVIRISDEPQFLGKSIECTSLIIYNAYELMKQTAMTKWIIYKVSPIKAVIEAFVGINYEVYTIV